MSETELSVVCKNCGSEVSPYVTECPYCGARLRKRAPKLERRGGGLEARLGRQRAARLFRRRRLRDRGADRRPYATLVAIVGPAVLVLLQKITGEPPVAFGAIVVPFDDELWRLFSTPFVYADVGYLFVICLALWLFSTGVEQRLGSFATAVLLVACGSLGALAASGIASAQGDTVAILGGNGMALGAVAAWFALRRSEARRAVDQDYDPIAVAVAAAVLIALPIFESTADFFAGLAGGVVGGLAGLAASVRRTSE